MTRELGVGIIGCGNISTTYFSLAPLFKGLKVLACADINVQAAEARAKEYGVKAQTIDALLANDEIDVVVNLTIPDAHFPVSKAILEGKFDTPEGRGAITTDELADIVIDGLAQERFLINTHPWVLEKFAVKARDYDEYIAMMRAGRAAELARSTG